MRYAAGCDLTAPDTSGLEEAAALAAVSDVTLLFVGLSIQIENEVCGDNNCIIHTDQGRMRR